MAITTGIKFLPPAKSHSIDFMKPAKSKPAPASETPVFPQTLHHVRLRTGKPGPKPPAEKRDNIFSKSRDTREDRGERQMKTSHNAQTIRR